MKVSQLLEQARPAVLDDELLLPLLDIIRKEFPQVEKSRTVKNWYGTPDDSLRIVLTTNRDDDSNSRYHEAHFEKSLIYPDLANFISDVNSQSAIRSKQLSLVREIAATHLEKMQRIFDDIKKKESSAKVEMWFATAGNAYFDFEYIDMSFVRKTKTVIQRIGVTIRWDA